MNCTQVTQFLVDLTDGSLEPLQTRAIEQHISSCAHCRLLVAQEHQLRKRLRKLPVTEPSEDFEQRILSHLKAAKPRKTRAGIHPWFAAGLGGALTAVVMLWMFSFNKPSIAPHSPLIEISVNLVPNQVQALNLAFNSKHRIDNAIFKILLPPHVELEGHHGKHELQWTGQLKQGTNRLSLPLIATHAMSNSGAEHFITARISHNGVSRDFKIKIVSAAQQSGKYLKHTDDMRT